MCRKNVKMASNTQGIQQLLAAEKKAADKVGEARKRKKIAHHLVENYFQKRVKSK